VNRCVAGLLTAAVFALGACGTSESPGGDSAPPASMSASPNTWNGDALPDPCRVATTAEISRVFGVSIGRGTRLKSWPPLCRFILDRVGPTFVYVSDNSLPSGKTDFDSRANEPTSEPVTGLGDRAYWQADLTTLHVLSGGTHFVVTFRGPKIPADAKGAAITLARLALPRTRHSP
jgi:hypothetical protein